MMSMVDDDEGERKLGVKPGGGVRNRMGPKACQRYADDEDYSEDEEDDDAGNDGRWWGASFPRTGVVMCTATDESAEDKSEDKSGDVTQIVKEYLNGDTLQNLVDKLKDARTDGEAANRLETVFDDDNEKGVSVGPFNCDMVPNPCPRKWKGAMCLALWMSLPKELRTLQNLIVINDCFDVFFSGVPKITRSELHMDKLLEVAKCAFGAIAPSMSPPTKAALSEALGAYSLLPSHVLENVKWLIERKPRPQLVSILLQLLDAGAFEESVFDEIGSGNIRTMLDGFRGGNLRTTENMVAKITNHQEYFENSTTNDASRSPARYCRYRRYLKWHECTQEG
ncbi:hypothetical protein TrRE_jg2391, partial [Triparma retinervis]